MSLRVAILICLCLASALAALEPPEGVVAIPSAEGPGQYGFSCGGAAVVIAPGQALTLVEALPERGPVILQIGDRRTTATEIARGTRTGAVLLSFPAELCSRPVPLAASQAIDVGMVVWTVGNSYGILEQDGVAALSRGIISGRYHLPNDSAPVRGRGGRILSEYRGEVFETDAAVNDGNQGGALLDDEGNLIGLVSLGQARERRLGTAIPLHLICADLGLPQATRQPQRGTGVEPLLAERAAGVAPSVALVYLERTAGLGNPEAMPRPAPITEEIPPYQRERLQQDWDRYYHQQQVFFTDQPVSALVVGDDLLLTSASHLHGGAVRGRVLTERGSVDCQVIATHTPLDLVLLRSAEPLGLPVADLDPATDLACGDAIAIVGRHRSQGGHTLTTGVVSTTERRHGQGEFVLNQTDAMANYGNLGGAIIDRRGRIIGMPVLLGPLGNRPWFINSGVAPFADAASIAKALPALEQGKSVEAPRIIGLGVSLEEDRQGLVVRSVSAGSGAKEAGIAVGDRIIAIDDQPVKVVMDVTRLLVRHHAGDTVAVRLQRGEEDLRIDVPLRVLGD